MPLGDELHQIAHIAAGRGDIGEARLPRSVRAAPSDREQRKLEQRFAGRAVGDGARRIGAGDDDAAPAAGKISRDRLDAHQRRHQHLVPARAQGGGGAFAIGLRAGDDEAHIIFSCA